MKKKIKLLEANIKQQMSKLEKCRKELEVFVKRKNIQKGVDNYDKATIGFYLHNFYNGCENIFVLIARAFENNIEPQVWHRSLLERMCLDIEDVRPAVIDEKLCTLLDNFLGFRHVFRHCYSFELDWNRERVVLEQFPDTFASFKIAMKKFLLKLDEMID